MKGAEIPKFKNKICETTASFVTFVVNAITVILPRRPHRSLKSLKFER